MRHLRIFASCIIAAAFLFDGTAAFCKPQQAGQIGRIDSLMNAVYRRGQFTGAVLVASHGKIIYEKAFGLADRQRQRPFTPDTREYIGSISKQMTAMGIMILHDRGKLRYDQPVRDFFPELPACMQPVTIRDLLYHTSGLARFDDYPNMTEQDVFKILLAQKELHFPPGEKFEYCNAGYSLLGMIIEKISGQTLNGFLQANLFAPIGMHHTLVTENGHPDTTRAIGYNLFGTINNYDTYMGGNASVVSTVGDLYLWDEAMAKDRLVSRDGGQDTWHDGAFSGYTAYNERFTGSETVIAEVSNLRGASVYEIRQAIVNILEGRPYVLPKLSGVVWLDKAINTSGVDSAVRAYQRLYQSGDPDYEFSEVALNSYAYILLRAGRVQEAIKLFQLNASLYPNSFNVYDSLADGYEKAGDKAAALATRKKALAIDPTSTYMQQRIASLIK